MGKIRGSTADCVQRRAAIFMASGKPLSVVPFKRSIDFDGLGRRTRAPPASGSSPLCYRKGQALQQGIAEIRVMANLPNTDGHSRPRFLILGAQKAGTVSLYRYLASHPSIVPAHRKEIGFFDQDTLFARGPDWYLSQFPAKASLGDRVTFEATPEYLYYPAVASRLFSYDPAIKLIVLLRNPIPRAISAWNMYRDLRLNHPDYLRSLLPECDESARTMINTMLADDAFPDAGKAMRTEIDEIRSGTGALDPGYVRRGLYHEQLQRYFAYFDRQQIAIVDSARLKAEPTIVLDELVRFLDLPAHDWHNTDLSLHHVGEYDSPVPAGTHDLLRDFYKPHNERLYELLGRDFGWDREAI